MWELLFALAQVVSILALVAGFGVVSWHQRSHSSEDRFDDP